METLYPPPPPFIFDKTGSFSTFYICKFEIFLYASKANVPGTPNLDMYQIFCALWITCT